MNNFSFDINNNFMHTLALGTVGTVGLALLYNMWRGKSITKEESDESFKKIGQNLLSSSSHGSSKPLDNAFSLLEKKDSELASVIIDFRNGKKVSSVEETNASLFLEDENYGRVFIEPFKPTWLQDYPQIIEHVESEHVLHVKGLDSEGNGLTWHTEKFKTDMDARLNPEAKTGNAERGGFQMKLGYFIVPPSKMNVIEAFSLSKHIQDTMIVKNEKDEVIGYRFFVHPKGYDHFRLLHQDSEIKYVSSEASEFIGTPTSSYRSWVVRHAFDNGESFKPAEGSIPFVVKLGVAGSILGADRWLSPNEIERSVQAQKAFDVMKKSYFDKEHAGSDFTVFPESLGLILKQISNYPEKDVDSKDEVKESGVLIREFPPEMLKGDCHILSMAALMSPERTKKENAGICSIPSITTEESQQLPLIFDIMKATIKAGKADSPEDFIRRYLIDGYLNAIKDVVFKEGLTLEPHSQNLCMVLNKDYTPKGFAYRDHGGIWIDIATRGLQKKDISPFHRAEGDSNRVFKSKGAIAKGYIGSFSWFYRYQVVVKIMNTMTRLEDKNTEMMKLPIGAPIQIGSDEKLEERNLRKFVLNEVKSTTDKKTYKAAKTVLNNLSITSGQYHEILHLLDKSYFKMLNRFFDMDKVAIQTENGALPSAEGGSTGDQIFYNHKGFLGKYRFNQINVDNKRVPVSELPTSWLPRIKNSVITSFEKMTLEDVKATECMVIDEGLCFFNDAQEIVGFMPYLEKHEKAFLENQLAK